MSTPRIRTVKEGTPDPPMFRVRDKLRSAGGTKEFACVTTTEHANFSISDLDHANGVDFPMVQDVARWIHALLVHVLAPASFR